MGNKRLVLPIFLSHLVAGEAAAICLYYAKANEAQLFEQLTFSENVHVEQAMNVLFVVADLALATSMVFLLRQHRSGFAKTDSIIQRIVSYTLSTSLVTVVVSTVALISVIVAPSSFLFLAADLTICKCAPPVPACSRS